jgi:multiple sugar transport system ATP-binding protein
VASVILKNIVKRFKSVTAVDDLCIEIQDKEFAVLVGPSGCGKTTALRMIAGLEDVTSGEITIGDRLVNDVAPKDRDIAMVFQNYALYPHMNVRDNLGFGLKMRKFPKAEIDQRVKEAADILGIHELLDRKPKQLSGGQRQRVAVGRAIVRKPEVFLFDEPLSNLDAKLRVAMRAEISKLHRRLEATIIYVTHDQVEAMTMASRIFIMQNGALQQSGVPLDVYRQPANRFVAGFIGSPAMNFLPARLVEEQGACYARSADFNVRLPDGFYPDVKAYAGRPVTFGVRPEDMAEQREAASDHRANTISARVEVVETLGAETFVHLTCGSHPMVARVTAPDHALIVGQEVEIALNMANVHLFDTDTSRTIV